MRITTRRSACGFTLACLLAAAVPALPVAMAQSQAVGAKPDRKVLDRMAAALKESKFRHVKTSEGLWTVTLDAPGDSREVVVYVSATMVVVSAELGTVTLNADSMKALLQANFQANFAKVALDEDGHVIALSELPTDFSAPALRVAIEEVAALAEEALDLVEAAAVTLPTETFPVVPAGTGATLSLVRGAFELTYDPRKWREQKTGDVTAFQFQHITGDAYVRVIAERMEIDAEAFPDLIIENARSAASDVTIESRTRTKINDLAVVIQRYSGSAKGVRFTFLNQAYSDKSGSVQIACWTGTSILDEYRRDFLELFAGFKKR